MCTVCSKSTMHIFDHIYTYNTEKNHSNNNLSEFENKIQTKAGCVMIMAIVWLKYHNNRRVFTRRFCYTSAFKDKEITSGSLLYAHKYGPSSSYSVLGMSKLLTLTLHKYNAVRWYYLMIISRWANMWNSENTIMPHRHADRLLAIYTYLGSGGERHPSSLSLYEHFPIRCIFTI